MLSISFLKKKLKMKNLIKHTIIGESIAEFIGTALLVFFGVGTIAAN